MRWLLAGYCWLALINISVAQRIIQRPRFRGVITDSSVGFHCRHPKNHPQDVAQWYKADKYNEEPGEEILAGPRTAMRLNLTSGSSLKIHKLRVEDSGVYFCKYNNTLGSGTELQVVTPISRKQAQYRTQMKDALIILQGLLLAVYIAAVLLRKRNLLEKSDSIYEEPETDHIYEGLTIETCGGGLYEELSVYAQAEGAEAPWE
ncbi:B-cell antigen receptor complex-associated protein beta chain [Symphorus nematophorus]